MPAVRRAVSALDEIIGVHKGDDFPEQFRAWKAILADSAHVFVEALITNAHDGKVFTSVSSDQYEGWFTKVDGIWKIKHWIDAPDVALPGGKGPIEGLP